MVVWMGLLLHWIEYEIADSLVKSAVLISRGNTCRIFDELSSTKRIALNALWRTPLAHLWYFGKRPRWCHRLNIPKNQQTPLSRFFNGHIKSVTFQRGRKVFPECHRCKTYQASPKHIPDDFPVDSGGFPGCELFRGFLLLWILYQLTTAWWLSGWKIR
ncbi:autophagy protein 5 [Trichonephila clavipes]|nr:autophagy protein 5 [Trichonephila clavipes]